MIKSPASSGDVLKIAGMAITISIIAYAFRGYIPRQTVLRDVPSAPYIWPPGCKLEGASADNRTSGNGYFRVEDEIPRACLIPNYYITDPGKYGLPRHYGVGRNYYRVGTDAINVDCLSDDKCVATNIERDVFL
jgi:hypothetical protein